MQLALLANADRSVVEPDSAAGRWRLPILGQSAAGADPAAVPENATFSPPTFDYSRPARRLPAKNGWRRGRTSRGIDVAARGQAVRYVASIPLAGDHISRRAGGITLRYALGWPAGQIARVAGSAAIVS
jgi:hypothetical protein